MPKTQAYVTKEKGTKVESMEVDMPEVGLNDVKVEMLCSGVCSSDVSMVQNYWGVSQFPIVAGHEGIGRVVEIGANVKTRKVGINAVGGLGHLAVQFAAKMGMEVVAMNRGMKKKDAALALGASCYIDSTDKDQMAAHHGTFDLLLDTAPVTAEMSTMLPLLGPAGKYVTVGVTHDGKKMEFENGQILGRDNSVCGSTYGSLSQLQDMMIFCSRHNITADCEVMPMSELSEALEKNDKGTLKRLRLSVVRQEKLDALKQQQSRSISSVGGA